jgi:hypothetical protein
MPDKAEYQKARDRQRSRDEYDWYKSHGICPRCRVKHGAPGGVYCEDCLVVKRKEMQKYFGDYNAAKCKERRERLKENGLCVYCSKPAVPNRVLCASCAQKNIESVKASTARRKCNGNVQ